MENKIHYLILKEKVIRKLCNQEMPTSQSEITNDYFQITCDVCKDILERDILKVPVKKRTEGEHRVLIKRFGGVREYLLSMGDFKDVQI